MSTSNDPGTLGPSDLIAAWQHFEERAADDKNGMIATVAWLIGVSVALIAIAATGYVEIDSPDPGMVRKLAGCALSLSGLAAFFVYAFAIHANRKYKFAKRVKEKYKTLYGNNKSGEPKLIFGEEGDKIYFPTRIILVGFSAKCSGGTTPTARLSTHLS